MRREVRCEDVKFIGQKTGGLEIVK